MSYSLPYILLLTFYGFLAYLYEQIDKIYEEAEKRRDEIIAGPKRDWINIKGAYYAQKSKEYLDILNVRDILSLFNL